MASLLSVYGGGVKSVGTWQSCSVLIKVSMDAFIDVLTHFDQLINYLFWQEQNKKKISDAAELKCEDILFIKHREKKIMKS